MYGENSVDLFPEYFKQREPDKIAKSYLWQTTIGLQKVDLI